MSLKGIGKFVRVLGLLTAGCSDSALPSAAPASSTPSLAAASGLSAEDEIDGIDLLAVESNGTLHLVWRELIGVCGERVGERIVCRLSLLAYGDHDQGRRMVGLHRLDETVDRLPDIARRIEPSLGDDRLRGIPMH